jgi:hypothetical protein
VGELFAAVPTAGYAAGRAWWTRFFDREPDLVPNDNEACWQVADHGWIYVIGDAERAGRALVTLLVDDLDAWLARLGDVGEIDTMPGGIRTCHISDPEGNTIQLGG